MYLGSTYFASRVDAILDGLPEHGDWNNNQGTRDALIGHGGNYG